VPADWCTKKLEAGPASSWADIYGKFLPVPVFTPWHTVSSRFVKYFNKGNVLPVGKTTRFAKMSNKTCLNSSFQDFMEEFGIEKPQGYRMVQKNMDAGFISCAKYDRPQPKFDSSSWKLACDWCRSHFGLAMRGSKVSTREEVLLALNKTTSAGFPWSLQYHDKNEMLESECAGVIDWYWDSIGVSVEREREGDPPLEHADGTYHPIWTCTQKVELRSAEKLDKNSIRTFTAAPIEHTVATNRLCLDFNNLFYAAEDTWSFVGRSKFAGGWHKLITRLLKHTEGIELDAKSYDASVFQRALLDQLEIRWEFLQTCDRTAANRARLVRLYEEIIWSYIVLENGELVRKSTGNPSGSANTIVDNTMVLFRVLAYCWVRGAPEHLRTYSEFMKNVEGALNGDDNDLAVAEPCRSFFNVDKITEYANELGVTMTAEHHDFLPIAQLTFLSQNSVKMFGMWMPSPSRDRLLSSVWLAADIDDPRWHLLRASAMLMDGWANLECRKIMRQYIEYLLNKYRTQMLGEVNGVTMDAISNNIKSDAWCLRLYTGHELSGCITITPDKINDKFINNPYNKYEENMAGNRSKGGGGGRTRKPRKFKLQGRKGHRAAQAPRARAAGATRSTPFRDVGGAVGGLFGNTGRALGSAAGSLIGSIFGMGAYTVNNNSIMTNSNGPPMFNASSAGSTIVSHREFLTDIQGSTAFTSQTFPLNPGLTTPFPWLSEIAENYQQYEFLGLVFEFKSTSAVAVNSTNTALGTVIMATNYNVAESAFTNKQQMEAYMFTTSTSPAVSAYHPVECSPKDAPLQTMYVRNGLPAAGTDLRMYDLGNFQIATVGMQAAANIGELWVTYHVKLLKPRLPNPLGSNLVYAHLTNPTASGSVGAPLNNVAVVPGSTLDCAVPTTATLRIRTPGRYLICVSSLGPGTTAAGGVGALGANCSAALLFNGNLNSVESGFVAATNWVSNFFINIAAYSDTVANDITIAGGTLSSAQRVDVFISQISSGLTMPTKLEEAMITMIKDIMSQHEEEERKNRAFSLDGKREIGEDYETIVAPAKVRRLL